MDTAKLSTEAKKALINAGTSRIGRKVQAQPEVVQELRGLGLVGPEGGLTWKGCSMRERAMTEALDAFFN